MTRSASNSVLEDTRHWPWQRTLAALLMTGQLVYVGWWVVRDVAIHISPDAVDWIGGEVTGYLLSVGMLPQSAFYCAVIFNCIALAATIIQPRRAWAAFLPAMLLYKVDWIYSILEGYEFLNINGSLSLILESVIMLLLLPIWLPAKPVG